MQGLKDKRIIIGGGATGIGSALAARLAAEGSRLVLGDINEAGLHATAAPLLANGAEIQMIPFDLADDKSIAALVQLCVDTFGGIDGLAIPAADLSDLAYRSDGPISEGVNTALWQRTLDINLIGHAKLIQQAAPYLCKQGGAIVTISSFAAIAGHANKPAYSASKAGLQALVRHVAQLYGKENVRCNAVAPGLVLTETALDAVGDNVLAAFLEVMALPRHGRPDDIAAAIAFLLSDDSAWITGQTLSVNGGRAFRD
jgi:NAD(P)-dependent dehydrogenase (short-subunit alcohol dehydrogenase family)